MTQVSIMPQCRRSNALDALDKLVARECEAIQVVARTPAPASAPDEEASDEDAAFVEGAVAYLSTRTNASELMADIDKRCKARRAAPAAPSPGVADGEPTQLDPAAAEPGAPPEPGP